MRKLNPGDVLYHSKDGKYHCLKILRIDEQDTLHVCSYQTVNALPALEEVKNIPVFAMHLPIEDVSDCVYYGNVAVEETELEGYHLYLKMVNFPAYAAEKGLDVDEEISKANDYYRQAYTFTDDKKYEEAIKYYSLAEETFPMFYEAIDNRAFVRMTVKDYEGAIADFRRSLEINSNSFLAIFSIGECYFKMGELKDAKVYFEQAKSINPDHEYPDMMLEKIKNLENKS